MNYIYLTLNDMTSGGGIYHYNGLDTTKFLDIKYNETATEAVIKTSQIVVPEHIQQIDEQTFYQYIDAWKRPITLDVNVKPQVTLQEIKELLDLLMMVQLEKEGIL